MHRLAFVFPTEYVLMVGSFHFSKMALFNVVITSALDSIISNIKVTIVALL